MDPWVDVHVEAEVDCDVRSGSDHVEGMDSGDVHFEAAAVHGKAGSQGAHKDHKDHAVSVGEPENRDGNLDGAEE